MPLSADDKLLIERIERNFTYHPPRADQGVRYERMRAHAKALAQLIVETCPDGRERALAITKLEEVIFWANASIARGEVE